jgi:hypothetical protein
MSLLDELAEEFNQDTILFIGSGASVPSGLPSWWLLVSWLRDYTSELGGNVETADVFLNEARPNLIDAASALTSQLSHFKKSLADFFVEYEKCNIFRLAVPQKVHQLIAQLPTSSIITPNYDVLLEKIYRDTGSDLQVVHKEDKDLLNEILRGRLKDYIFKYHGCITKPENIVLDFNQYNAAKFKPSFDMECLKSLIVAKTFVFIGAGLDDPDFSHVRDNIIFIAGSQRIEFWAFMKNCETKVAHYKRVYGIKLISYKGDSNDHSDLLNKLEELQLKISSEDKRKAEAASFASPVEVISNNVHGILRKKLIQVNEEVIPLDEQILGFVAFFDIVEKEKCYSYLSVHKGNDLDEVLNRIDYLVKRQLLKTTEHFLLPVKESYSVEAAVKIEDDIMEYLMESDNE